MGCDILTEIDAEDFASFNNNVTIVEKFTDREIIYEVKENPASSEVEISSPMMQDVWCTGENLGWGIFRKF